MNMLDHLLKRKLKSRASKRKKLKTRWLCVTIGTIKRKKKRSSWRGKDELGLRCQEGHTYVKMANILLKKHS